MPTFILSHVHVCIIGLKTICIRNNENIMSIQKWPRLRVTYLVEYWNIHALHWQRAENPEESYRKMNPMVPAVDESEYLEENFEPAFDKCWNEFLVKFVYRLISNTPKTVGALFRWEAKTRGTDLCTNDFLKIRCRLCIPSLDLVKSSWKWTRLQLTQTSLGQEEDILGLICI